MWTRRKKLPYHSLHQQDIRSITTISHTAWHWGYPLRTILKPERSETPMNLGITFTVSTTIWTVLARQGNTCVHAIMNTNVTSNAMKNAWLWWKYITSLTSRMPISLPNQERSWGSDLRKHNNTQKQNGQVFTSSKVPFLILLNDLQINYLF